MPIPEISPVKAASMLKEHPDIKIIDVRTDEEHRTAKIEGAMLVNDSATLRQVLSWPKTTAILVYCQNGVRGRKACSYLRTRDFRNVMNLAGGIDAWAKKINKKVPR